MCTEPICEQLSFSFNGLGEKPARTKRYPNCGLWYYCECGSLVGIKNEKGRMILKMYACEDCEMVVDWEGIEDGN